MFSRQTLILALFVAGLSLVPLPGQESPPISEKPSSELREQTVYIPYTKLRALFEKEGRGVFLPYEEFQSLWEAARGNNGNVAEVRPPLGSLITAIDSQAEIQAEVMTVTSQVSVDLLEKGWHEVPLRLNQAAIREATVGDEPARLLFSGEKGYTLLLENKNDEAITKQVKLTYAKAYQQSPGKNFVEFMAPQAPINRWRIRVPDQGVEIEVQPNIASENIGLLDEGGNVADPSNTDEGSGELSSLVQAFVGGADRVRIDWTAKAEGAAGLSALVTVQTRQQVTIEEGVIRTRAQMIYDISRADINSLEIQVPSDHNIVNVFDPNLQRWEKTLDGDVQTLTLSLFQPTRGTQPVVLEFEKFAGGKEMSRPMMQTEIVAPVIRATRAGKDENQVTVGRQQGIVVVKIDNSLRGETVSRTGLTQIDPDELPNELSGQNWTFAYRYASVPYDLRISVEKLLPDVEVAQLSEVYIQPDRITATLAAIYDIQRTGIFQIELLIPGEYTVRAVQGIGLADAQPFVVESYDVQRPAGAEATDDGPQLLVVSLGRRALGKAAIMVNIDRSLNDPNLAQPTDEVSNLILPVPRVNPASVNRGRGKLLVYGTESLRLNPSGMTGVSPIALGEAAQPVPSIRGGRLPSLREIAAYAFTQQPVVVNFTGQRRKPYIEARQFLEVNVEAGNAAFQSTFLFDVRYSGVESLRIDIPQNISDRIRNDSAVLREQVMQPQPADVEEGYVAWSLSGENELLGSQEAKLSWDLELGDLPVGEAVPIAIPKINPINVDRSWGQIVASKAETIEVSVADTPEGLRPIDPQRDLFPGLASKNAARAFEYYGDWQLTLQVTRYELEEVKRTSIDRALVRMVQTRSREVSVQAIYRVRSARQRIAVQIPGVDPNQTDGNLDSQPLRINGQPAILEHDGTQFFIPFTGFSPDDAVVVELRYSLPDAGGVYEIPVFPEEPAIQQVHLAFYLPEDRTLLFTDGPWSDDEEVSFFERYRYDTLSDDYLLDEIRQTTECSSLVGQDFPVDGQRYLFSTLRPEPGASGALRMTSMKEMFFHTALVIMLSLVGIALCFRNWGARMWWLSMVAVAILMSGIFAPRFAMAVWRTPLFVTISLTVGLWAVQGLMVFTPKVTRWVSSNLTPPDPPSRSEESHEPTTSSVTESDGSENSKGEHAEAAAEEGEVLQSDVDPDSKDDEGGKSDE
jgi:hypothetical protein